MAFLLAFFPFLFFFLSSLTVCAVFCDTWAPGICLQTFQLFVIDPSPIPELIWQRRFLNCIVYLATILAFHCSDFCMLSPFHLQNYPILLYQTDMEIAWMSFFKIQNNSFQSFRTLLRQNFELNFNSINYFNQIWQKKEKLGLFFFHNALICF